MRIGEPAWIEVRTTREELHLRIEQVERRLDGRIDQLEQRSITEIHAVAGQLQDIKDLFRDRLDLRDRVVRCERDIDELKHRAG